MKKQIAFSNKLLAKAEQRASELGITLGPYIRFLILQDTSNKYYDLERKS